MKISWGGNAGVPAVWGDSLSKPVPARDRFYTLFKVTGAGTLTGTPTLVAADDLAPWTLVNTGRELRLAFPAGSVFILR